MLRRVTSSESAGEEREGREASGTLRAGARAVRVAPSVLSADFARLGDEVRDVVEAGADLLHLDVMDGHFVENITFGPPLVRSVRGATSAVLDCHLMVSHPTRWVRAFREAGADWISVHAEAPDDLAAALSEIRALGARAGIVVNPATPLDRARPFFPRADYVLVMSVVPGFGGQAFLPDVLEKVRALRREGYVGDVEIDGGINPATAALAVEAGVDVLVAGSAVFSKRDRSAAIRALRGL
jgi:ribulose-phosphate 3-epimerase